MLLLLQNEKLTPLYGGLNFKEVWGGRSGTSLCLISTKYSFLNGL